MTRRNGGGKFLERGGFEFHFLQCLDRVKSKVFEIREQMMKKR